MARIIGIDIGSLYTKVIDIECANKIRLKRLFYFKTPYLDIFADKKTIDKKGFIDGILNNIPLHVVKNAKVAVNIP